MRGSRPHEHPQKIRQRNNYHLITPYLIRKVCLTRFRTGEGTKTKIYFLNFFCSIFANSTYSTYSTSNASSSICGIRSGSGSGSGGCIHSFSGSCREEESFYSSFRENYQRHFFLSSQKPSSAIASPIINSQQVAGRNAMLSRIIPPHSSAVPMHVPHPGRP